MFLTKNLYNAVKNEWDRTNYLEGNLEALDDCGYDGSDIRPPVLELCTQTIFLYVNACNWNMGGTLMFTEL